MFYLQHGNDLYKAVLHWVVRVVTVLHCIHQFNYSIIAIYSHIFWENNVNTKSNKHNTQHLNNCIFNIQVSSCNIASDILTCLAIWSAASCLLSFSAQRPTRTMLCREIKRFNGILFIILVQSKNENLQTKYNVKKMYDRNMFIASSVAGCISWQIIVLASTPDLWTSDLGLKRITGLLQRRWRRRTIS